MISRFYRTILLATATALTLTIAAPAYASHYDLADVDLVSADARDKLATIGVTTTKALLERVSTKEGREDTALAAGLSEAEMQALTQTLDLMQIIGVGPRAARLLLASGITSTAVLATSDPNELLDKLVATNLTHQITGVDPDLPVVEDWISKAAKVEVSVE